MKAFANLAVPCEIWPTRSFLTQTSSLVCDLLLCPAIQSKRYLCKNIWREGSNWIRKAEDSVTAIEVDAHVGSGPTENEKPLEASNLQVSGPRATEPNAAGSLKEATGRSPSETKIEKETAASNDNEAEGEKEAEAAKPQSNPELERKREIVAGEAKKAGKRLFGMMLGTLKSLKDDNSKRSKTAGVRALPFRPY